MKKLFIPEFAKILTANPDREQYVAAYYNEEVEELTVDDCEGWFAFKVSFIGDCPVMIANYCGSPDPYSLRIYPISEYIDDNNHIFNLENAIVEYMKDMDEFEYEGFVCYDDESAI